MKYVHMVNNIIMTHSDYYDFDYVRKYQQINQNSLPLYYDPVNGSHYIACDRYTGKLRVNPDKVRISRYSTNRLYQVHIIDFNIYTNISMDSLVELIITNEINKGEIVHPVEFTFYRKNGWCQIKLL